MQQDAYYQQYARYKMNIDVDAANFLTTENKKFILIILQGGGGMAFCRLFQLVGWNAFKPGSIMDQRVQTKAKMQTEDLGRNGVSRLSTIPPKKKSQKLIKKTKWKKK